MKITLKQIAQEAGVSQATVSRLVNQNAGVSLELEEKVLLAAKRLGVNLPMKKVEPKDRVEKGKVIGILVTDLGNPYFQTLLRSAVSESRMLNLGVQVFETLEDYRAEQENFFSVEKFSLDGLIIFASRLPESQLLDFHQRNRLPMVVVNRYIADPSICCIVVDFERAMFHATMHLINLGHRRIAYLCGPANSAPSLSRKIGIVNALEKSGLKLDNDLYLGCIPTIEGGFQAMISLLALPEEKRPSAIIAYNDQIAIGALKAARLKGFNVPQDISIIGVDNIDFTEHSSPPLTTISVPKAQIGSMAMRLMYQILSGNYTPVEGYIELDAPLILRDSTGPAKADVKSVPIELSERHIL